MVPDIISVVDDETGRPILTVNLFFSDFWSYFQEELSYGLRIAVIALPADPILRKEECLSVVGPAAYG